MLYQMASGLEGHATDITSMRQTSLMSLNMNLLVLFTGEGAITDLTNERLFSSVTSVMRGQGVLLLEGHWTPIALERVVLNVSVMVIFQLHLVSESFVAIRDRASERPLRLMNSLDMFVQTAFFTKLLVAVRTYFGDDIAMQPQMPGVALLLQGEAANRTTCHLRRHPKVMEHVAHQGLVVFEHLCAESTHQLVEVITARHNGRNIKLLA